MYEDIVSRDIEDESEMEMLLMKQGERVEIQMQKALGIDGKKDDCTYIGEVIRYDSAGESLYFVLTSAELTALSLDAVYECKIYREKKGLACMGKIRERYCSKAGKTVKFEIKNGFYKINIK